MCELLPAVAPEADAVVLRYSHLLGVSEVDLLDSNLPRHIDVVVLVSNSSNVDHLKEEIKLVVSRANAICMIFDQTTETLLTILTFVNCRLLAVAGLPTDGGF